MTTRWGITDDSEDLREIVDAVLDEARRWEDRYPFPLRVEWTLGGTPLRAVEQAVAVTGIELPTSTAR